LNIKESIKKANIILIEGENKSGKLSTALYFSTFLEKKVTIISTIIKPIMNKRLKAIKMLQDKNINSLLENLSLLCLKEDWEKVKAEFGFDFLLEDIKKIIKDKTPEILILHRPEIMFNRQEEEFAKQYIEDVIEICSDLNIKLIITLEENSFLVEKIENFSEINFLIKKLSSNEREINIKHSLYPIDYENFILKWQVNKLIILEKSIKKPIETIEKEKPLTQNRKSLLIITNDEYLQQFHQYVFEKEFILDFAKNLSEVISKLLKNPEIVIYNPEDEKIDTQICESFKNTTTKIIYIVNKDYTRNIDKMNIFAAGCYEVIPKNFIIEEYILLIEKLSNSYFYLNKIKLLNKKNIIKNKNHFFEIVNTLYKERIYFSIVIGKANENIFSKIRHNDIIFKENDTIFLCLIDTNRYIYEKIIKKKLNLKEEKFIEAIEWEDNGKNFINFNS